MQFTSDLAGDVYTLVGDHAIPIEDVMIMLKINPNYMLMMQDVIKKEPLLRLTATGNVCRESFRG